MREDREDGVFVGQKENGESGMEMKAVEGKGRVDEG